MAVTANPYPPQMGLFSRRLIAPLDIREYLDAANGAVAERLKMTERVILERMEASDKAASEQHIRMDQRMSAVEHGLTGMGERVGSLEQQHERDRGREQAKEQIMVPWLRGVIMPVMVILIVLILGAGAGALVVGANQKATAPMAAPVESCATQVQDLIASRSSYRRSTYLAAVEELAAQGCATTAALSHAPTR